MDKILAILPVFNTEKYVQGAIESLIQQKDVDVFICIVDDCSTDNSFDIIKKYEDLDNVKIFKNKENRGCFYSQNRALEWATSNLNFDFFTIHGSDDISTVDRYSRMLKLFSESVYAVPCTYYRVHEKYFTDNSIDYLKGEHSVGLGNGIGLYRKEIFYKIGYFDNSRFSADSDYYFRAVSWCKLNGKQVKIFSEPCYFARDRSGRLRETYPMNSRNEYISKINKEIREMSLNNNFYRNIFN